jgi:hypothetical protein
MRQAMEMIKSLKYKLRMFGIKIMENETKVFGDNNAVILLMHHIPNLPSRKSIIL